MPTVIPSITMYRFNGLSFVMTKLYYPCVIVMLSLLAACYPLSANNNADLKLVAVPKQPAQSELLPKVTSYIKHTNATLSDEDATNFARYALNASKAFKLEISLLLALAKVESGFKPEATSGAGALGLTQVIPKWHSNKIAVSRKITNSYSIFEPRLNLYVGAWALKDFITSSGSIVSGLLLYNGSKSDPKKQYARLVLAEAENVRKNFLNQ